MVVIIFGLAASGKTYIGEIMAKHFGFHHQDADQWLLDDMKQAILAKENFTLEMLDRFTTSMIQNINYLKKQHPKLVISQALYRKKNREEIMKNFPSNELVFIQAHASDEVIITRLETRNGWVDPQYAAGMRLYFETMEHAKIINNDSNGEEDIIKQLELILNETL